MSFPAVMPRSVAACAALLCLLMVASPALADAGREPPALTPVPRDALTRALGRGKLSEAEYALERARSLFDLAAVRRGFGDVARPDPRAATPILRDLVVRRSALRGEEAQAAAQILARPGARHDACDATRPLCFHWGNRVAAPDVTATETTFAAVYDLEVGDYGFRPPLPDGTRGGNSSTDVYLEDLGADGIFGYCTTDDPSRAPDVYAYCVVDDDFAEFGDSQTPEEFRDVTAAHEFFHAIQFGYDVAEDLWLMEGTAMVMEGQFRPDVKDRIRYLDDSTLTSPPTPVDLGAGGFEYGAWIFWRFLIEDRGELADPLVIRQVWEAADGSSDEDGPGPDAIGPDAYSLLAVRRVLAARGLSFRQVFAHFAWVNRVPGSFYAEGAEYPAARAAAGYALGPSRHSTGWLSYRIKHLAQRYVVLKPRLTAPPDMHVRVRVDLPNLRSGPVANLLIHYVGGGLSLRPISLDSTGRGSRVVPLGRGAVRRVDLILTNASARFHCWQGTNYSCAGLPVDDLRTYRFVATVL